MDINLSNCLKFLRIFLLKIIKFYNSNFKSNTVMVSNQNCSLYLPVLVKPNWLLFGQNWWQFCHSASRLETIFLFVLKLRIWITYVTSKKQTIRTHVNFFCKLNDTLYVEVERVECGWSSPADSVWWICSSAQTKKLRLAKQDLIISTILINFGSF